jgi:hypothetical protein
VCTSQLSFQRFGEGLSLGVEQQQVFLGAVVHHLYRAAFEEVLGLVAFEYFVGFAFLDVGGCEVVKGVHLYFPCDIVPFLDEVLAGLFRLVVGIEVVEVYQFCGLFVGESQYFAVD